MSTMKKKTIHTVALVAVLVILSTVGFSAARYVSNHRKEAQIHASNFHFSSDYLAYDPGNQNAAPSYEVSNWGTQSIRFQLYNYQTENIEQISEADIVYSIALSNPNWKIAVTDELGNAVEPEASNYTMEASTFRIHHTVTLSYTGTDPNPAQVGVTVLASAPYKMALEANFTATTRRGVEYTLEDMGDYNILTIHTNQYYGPLTIGWKNTHAPDNTCDYMGSWINVTSGTIENAKEYMTYTLIFTENVSGDYTKDAFYVEIDTGA